MEPFTTNSTQNPEHKNHDDHHRQLPHDHDQPLIISCKVKPHQEMIKNFSNPSSCEPCLIENAGDEREKRLENEAIGREKLRRHWEEMSVGGGVVIPERWGQEELLQEWIDYSTFDALLGNKEAELAREALVAEARRGCRVSKLPF